MRDSLGLSIPIDLHRLNLPVDLIRPRTPHNEATPILFLSAAPTRPPSSLPPPHDITLRTSVAEYLGSGRTGLVYILSDPVLSDPNNKLPELVFKFPRSHRCADIYRESWFYEGMERLQGVAIPRCYGLFEADLPVGCAVRLPDGRTLLAHEEFESPDASVDDLPHPDILKPRSTRNKIFVLVLERLGGRLPIGKPIPADVRYVTQLQLLGALRFIYNG